MLDTQLIAFLEANPNTKYEYSSTDNCAAAQFNKSIGREYPLAHALSESQSDNIRSFDGRLEKAARQQPWNFGSASERFKALEPA